MLIISGISMAAVGLYARRFVGRVPAATPFILLMFCAMGWSVLYAIDLMTPVLPLRVFYHNLRFIFLPFIPVLEIWLVLTYVNRTEWIRKSWGIAAIIVPAFFAILAMTSPWHTLFRYDFSISTAGPVPVLQYTEGIGYLVYNVYTGALLVLGIILLVSESRRRGTLWVMPTILLLIALAFPVTLNYVSLYYGFPFPGINLTPAILWITAILYTIALFRYRFLDIIPIARSRLIEALNIPVLVLDTEGRVIDTNPAALSLFSLPPAEIPGRPVSGIAPDWPDLISLCNEHGQERRSLTRTGPDGTRYYIGSIEPLQVSGGEAEGYLVFLQDVTELRNTGEELRVKTHDLGERVKELRCLYEISHLIEMHPSEAVLFQTVADCIPSGWQYPDLTGAKIATGDGEFRSGNYRDGAFQQEADILVHGSIAGKIEVSFFGKGDPAGTGSPFLKEEEELLHAIAERMGRSLERTRAEQELREKTEELDQYFNTSLDLFCIADMEGYFRRLNPQWETTLGYPLDELEGKRFLDLIHPDDLQATLGAMGDLRSQHEVLNFTNRYRHRNGTYRWIEWRSFPKGNRVYAAARDITGRKQIEGALRDSEEKYRSIIDQMQDLFYRTDTGGKITMLSPSAARISGYPLDELIGKDVTQVYADPKDRERLLEALRENGSVDSFPLVLKIQDGSTRLVTTSSHFYRDVNGNIAGVEGVIHDMTERKRAEDALRMANKKLNLLSSITRHDIRNQLMALNAFLELSEQAINNPAELAEFLKRNQKIAETISRQISFTKDYEDFGVRAPAWQSISGVIDRAVSGLPLKNVRFVNDTTGIEIFADPLVEKVFYNLIDNALRYGGERMTTIHISSREEGGSLVLVASDDGIGIDARDKRVIFDKGFGKNTGLGLYLSREILSITGITIEETGVPGCGAQFEIIVPPGGFRFITPAR